MWAFFFFLLFSFCSTVIYINSLRLFLTIISLLLQYTLVILGTSSQSQSYLKLTLAFKQSIHWPYHFSYLSHFFLFFIIFCFYLWALSWNQILWKKVNAWYESFKSMIKKEKKKEEWSHPTNCKELDHVFISNCNGKCLHSDLRLSAYLE